MAGSLLDDVSSHAQRGDKVQVSVPVVSAGPNRKRPRLAIKPTSGKPSARLQGRLANFMTIPVDIFTEICAHLLPLDVLNLARTSKRLRGILMSRNSRFFWKEALQQVPDLPPCPEDLTEPQYVDLVFGKSCSLCGSSATAKTYYRLRLRMCEPCKRENRLRNIDVSGACPNADWSLLELVPRYRDYSRRGEHLYNKSELMSVLHQYSTLETSQLRDDFRLARKLMLDVITQSSGLLESWEATQRTIKEIAREKLKAQHATEVMARLESEGWDKRDFPPPFSRRWRSLVHKPRQLTNRAWLTLQPTLVAMIIPNMDARQMRMSNRRVEIESFLCPPLSDVLGLISMPRSDFFELPSIKQLLDSSVPISLLTWGGLPLQVSVEVGEFRQGVIKQLWDMLAGDTSALSASPSTVEPWEQLQLATSCFGCTECNATLWYQDLLVHPHFEGPWDAVKGRIIVSSARPLIAALLRGLWNDSHTMTLTRLNQYSMACLCCDSRLRLPMSWRELVDHFVSEQAWYSIASNLTDSYIVNDHNSAGATGPLISVLWAEEIVDQIQRREEFLSQLQEEYDIVQQIWPACGLSPPTYSATCKLCPASLRTQFDTFAYLKLHIEIKHNHEFSFDVVEDLKFAHVSTTLEASPEQSSTSYVA